MAILTKKSEVKLRQPYNTVSRWRFQQGSVRWFLLRIVTMRHAPLFRPGSAALPTQTHMTCRMMH